MGIALQAGGVSHGHSHGGVESKHNHSHDGAGKDNINVRAAFIHVIGDFVQSLGVLVAAFVIYFKVSIKIHFAFSNNKWKFCKQTLSNRLGDPVRKYNIQILNKKIGLMTYIVIIKFNKNIKNKCHPMQKKSKQWNNSH